MQEETRKDTPMVDIDTSGPSAEVELKDEAQTEEQVETKELDTSPEPQAASDEKQEASSEETDDQKDAKDKELENYSKDVQRRIAKLTGKWREAQRQRDEAIEFARLQKQKAEEASKKYSSIEQASVKDREQSIVSGIEAAQVKLAAAREEGNIAAEIEAQKQIARLGYEEARLAEAKAMAEAAPKVEKKADELPVFNQQTQPQQQVDPRAEAWGSKNKWFGTDTAMTYTAFDIHNKLELEGYDPQSDEYYAEIDKRIRLEFPHKFDTVTDTKAQTTKPVQTVAAATRSTKTGRKTISLTPSEVAIAKKIRSVIRRLCKTKKTHEGGLSIWKTIK
jgi:hypothetical protein